MRRKHHGIQKASSQSQKSSDSDIQTLNSYPTLALDSISKGKELTEYWNEHCLESQSLWWLPHQTESPDQDSQSSKKSCNYTVAESKFWKKTIFPKTSTSINLFHISPHSAIPSTESALIKGTRKIRIFPKNEIPTQLVSQQRRAYNLAISCFAESDKHIELRDSEELRKTELRRTIREFVREEVSELGDIFMSSGVDESVVSAYLTRDAVIRNRKKGLASGYSYKSRKSPKQSFIVQKLSKKFMKDNFSTSEALPTEAFGKLTKIVFEHGRWFVCAQKHIETRGWCDSQAKSVVSLDPGVRDFLTSYSSNESTTYGQNFYSEKVFPLLLKIDSEISKKGRSNNDQWKRHHQKKVTKLRNRVRDLITDLHNRVAYDLVKKYDVILLPKFETKSMAAKLNRKLRSKTVRSMLGLRHYEFKLKLQWMCKKYGKLLVEVDESYTSKTYSWNGYVDRKLGSKKVIKDGHMAVDRDVNGARGIMLKALYGNSNHLTGSQACACCVKN